MEDLRLTRPDGRTVAWTDWGDPDGIPLLRVPGTPGSRLGLRADKTAWEERGLRVLTTERPGFGASTPLPGRGFAEPADDLAAVLDAAGVDTAFVYGGSGSAGHQLSLAARHPDRVRAMTVLVGAAPLEPSDAAVLIGLNARAYELAVAGDREGLTALLSTSREAILADPLGAFRGIMDTAPEADRLVMQDPLWQEGFLSGITEALRVGVDGWVDEAFANLTRWDDVDVAAVQCSVTWWHAAGDANAPLSAARRLVARIPGARLELFGEQEGHFAPYSREPQLLDELLARG